ncbi:MAG: hypothetical protein MK098_01775 [Marinovum sp.]|nr:hypothetical protein [Marinovum sp.]
MSLPNPRFLQRQTYRRRRRADAARILPTLGLALMLVPLLLQTSTNATLDVPAARTSMVALFVFAVLAGLSVVSFFLARAMARDEKEGPANLATSLQERETDI